ncbi:TetR/AcrR family transcriptional regulator [Limnohabitans sp.]|uniref:TetR/AcrR family transcriptional regulator n=1 Tax=Limnohabitans sp. TaxID=1907725 RepID=UPI00333F8E8C
MATKKASTKKTSAPVTVRLTGAEREKHIAQEAVRFFAEVGFGGDTRELAKRLGVTQSLLYKYFPSKEALINRVFEEVYLGRWNPFWESVVRDRSIPLEERLTRLYIEYAKIALTRDWVRIFMFSGLRGEDINRRYLDILRERILVPIAIELRHELGLPSIDEIPLKSNELELVWSINARVFYFGQRQWIFDVPIEDDLDDLIRMTIEHFMAGARVVMPSLLGITAVPKRRVRALTKGKH